MNVKKNYILKRAVTILLSGFLAFLVGGISIQAVAEDFNIGERFIVPGVAQEDNVYVIDASKADVTGDGVEDQVILVGAKLESPQDIYSENIAIIVKEGKTEKYLKNTYDKFNGYVGEKSLFIGDFTGDQVSDVMVTAGTGGTGGYMNHLIVTFKDNQSKIVFDEEDNLGIKIDGEYIDGFKAAINVKELHRDFLLDLSVNKDDYIKLGIYDENGKILNETKPYMGPFINLKPSFIDSDGVHMLKGTQRIVGAWNADSLSFVESTWKYEEGDWQIQSLQYSTYIVKN